MPSFANLGFEVDEEEETDVDEYTVRGSNGRRQKGGGRFARTPQGDYFGVGWSVKVPKVKGSITVELALDSQVRAYTHTHTYTSPSLLVSFPPQSRAPSLRRHKKSQQHINATNLFSYYHHLDNNMKNQN